MIGLIELSGVNGTESNCALRLGAPDPARSTMPPNAVSDPPHS
jgi:hypothetical protein